MKFALSQRTGMKASVLLLRRMKLYEMRSSPPYWIPGLLLALTLTPCLGVRAQKPFQPKPPPIKRAFDIDSVKPKAPITGAFGIELGSKFDPPAGYPPGAEIVEITPKNPDPFFTSYSVWITPTTHLVYAIKAVCEDPRDPEQSMKKMRGLLAAKYGPFTVDSTRRSELLSTDGRLIMWEWQDPSPQSSLHTLTISLTLSYFDKRLTDQAWAEALKLKKAQKFDPSF